jgi:ribosomal protein S18 acetylase RimI-like enzyme
MVNSKILKQEAAIKVLTGSEIKIYEDTLSDFYFSKYNISYKKAVSNSDYVVIATVKDKIVGALRIITDKTRYALIVNVAIDEHFQNMGIGTRIMNQALEVCLNESIENIRLFANPTKEKTWIVNFYKRLGFKKYGAIPMEYRI